MVQYSLISLKLRGVAVSARPENAGVTGSTPVLSTILRWPSEAKGLFTRNGGKAS